MRLKDRFQSSPLKTIITDAARPQFDFRVWLEENINLVFSAGLLLNLVVVLLFFPNGFAGIKLSLWTIPIHLPTVPHMARALFTRKWSID